jgi:lysozyme
MRPDEVMSMGAVMGMFQDDMDAFADDVNRALKVPVTQYQFDALCSFHYNTGGISRANITKHVNSGRIVSAGHAFMAWRRPPEIIQRRLAEQTLFNTGSYTKRGWATIYKTNGKGRIVWSSAQRVDVASKFDLADQPPPKEIRAILRAGSIGTDVGMLQQVLGVLKDGMFGPITKAALKAYQRDNNLVVDGIAGPQTLGHMGLLKRN